jgi:hypothetical protein
VAVEYDTPEMERARAAADEGEYSRAATLAARSAHGRLVRFAGERRTNRTLAVGELLYAIHYARRGGDDETADRLREALRAYASLLQREARDALREDWPSMTWACLLGLFEEWVGDAHLFTGDDAAGGYYDRAERWYRAEDCREQWCSRTSVAPCWQWGDEPGFEKAWAAFRDHAGWCADDLTPFPEDCRTHFFDRLDRKRAVLTRLGSHG